MPALTQDTRVFESLLHEHLPEVAKHLEDVGFDMRVVMPRWLICMFLTSFGAEVAIRVWDCVFAAQEEAPKVLLMVSG